MSGQAAIVLGVRRSIGVAALALAIALAAAGAGTAAPDLPGTAQLQAVRAQLDSAAQQGVADAARYWWDARLGWYDDTIGDPDAMPLVRLWSAYPLFESLSAVAIAHPTPQNLQAVRSFVAGAEAYWNPDVGGYAYYPGERGADKMTFFDDNGWWGLAFMDAWRATGDRRALVDAARAFHFIVTQGWAPQDGGVWWDTRHHKTTSEPLAAAILLGVLLNEATHQRSYLQTSLRLLTWANRYTWNAARGLYQRNPTDPTVMDYVEGMMAAAHAELCKVTHRQGYCAKADLLARNAQAAFVEDLNWGPQYDSIYLRWLLDVYTVTGDSDWYGVVYRQALRAFQHARDARGLWTRAWDGGSPYLHGGQANMLEFHAATTSVFAWLAATPLPAS